jgi:hypothetical protein
MLLSTMTSRVVVGRQRVQRACWCREVVRYFSGSLGRILVMRLVLSDALKLALAVVLVDRGVVQAAVRYSLMSPAQVV